MKAEFQVQRLLIDSLIVAVICFLGPFLFRPFTRNFIHAVYASFGLTLLWIGLFCVALFGHRKMGLWLLLGAPLAFFYPVASVLFLLSCSRNGCL